MSIVDNLGLPNSGNLFAMLTQQLDQHNKLINLVSQSPIENKEVVNSIKRVGENSTAVVNSLVSDIAKQGAGATGNIKKIAKGTTLAIGRIVDSMTEIQMELSRIDIDSMTGMMNAISSDPIGLIRAAKGGQPYVASRLSLLETYLNIVILVGQVAKAGKDMKKRNIKAAISGVVYTVRGLVTIQRSLISTSKGLKIITPVLSFIIDRSTEMFEKMTNIQDNLIKFTENSKAISFRKIKKSIRNLFVSYIYIIYSGAQVADYLFNNEINHRFWGFRKQRILRRKRMKVKDIFRGFFAMTYVCTYLRLILKIANPTIDKLVKLASYGLKPQIGAKIFTSTITILLNSIDNFSPRVFSKRMQKNMLQILVALIQIRHLMWIFKPIAMKIIELGVNFKYVYLGLIAFRSSLNDKKIGLLSIIRDTKVTIRVYFRLLKLIVLSSELMTLFTVITPVINQLIRMGRNKKTIKRGLAAFKIAVLAMIDIVNWKVIATISLARVWMTTKKVFLLTVCFTAMIAPLQVIGGMLPLILAATVVVMLVFPLISLMLFNLAYVRLFQRRIKKDVKVLRLLGNAYREFFKDMMLMAVANAGLAAAVATIVAIDLMIISMVAIIRFIGKWAKKPTFTIGMMMLLKMSLTVIILAGTFSAAAMLISGISFAAFGILGSSLLTLLGIFAFAGAINMLVMSGGLALLTVGIALVVIASSIAIMLNNVERVQEGTIRTMLMLMGSISLIFVAAGVFSPFIILGSAAMLIMGVALVVISLPIRMFTKSIERLNSMNYAEDTFAKLIRTLANGINEMFKNILVFNPVTLLFVDACLTGLMPVVRHISRIARIMQDLAELKLPVYDERGKKIGKRVMTNKDFVNAAANGNTIVTFFSALFKDRPTRLANGVMITGISMASLKRADSDSVKKIRKVKRMVGHISDMAESLQNIASLTIPVYDKSGKEIGRRAMTPGDFQRARDESKRILLFFASLFDEKDPNCVITNKLLRKLKMKTGIRVRRLGNLTKPIVDMIQSIKGAADLRMPVYDKTGQIVEGKTIQFTEADFTKAKENINKMFTTIVGSVMSLNLGKLKQANKRLKIMKKIAGNVSDISTAVAEYKEISTSKLNNIGSTMNSFYEILSNNHAAFNIDRRSKVLEESIDNTVRLLKQVDRTDLNKLKYAYSLVKAMADFAKEIDGDFDKLADVINDKLIKILEKLHDAVRGVNGDLYLGGKKILSSSDSTPSHNKDTGVPTPSTTVATTPAEDIIDVSGIEDSLSEIIKIIKSKK